jgi:uncharacterized protein YyaL (SSP411 family)
MTSGRTPLPDAASLASLPRDGGADWNRLVFEKSPYLLQHAANPVDWHSWGEEAFEAARSQGKAVFLSIGYATCHWCHVMERESFEDEQVAALLNEAFICVKVDREERPDVDHAYMAVTQALTGAGGWPMTVVMTPDRKPFFAGTYFPKDARHGRPGMLQLVPMLRDAWTRQRDAVVAEAERITRAMAETTTSAPGEELTPETLGDARDQLAARFDPAHGGFGHAPKFPTPHQLSLLLRCHRRSGDAQALAMVEATLASMRRGGIFDHVGFGYHRYSTDRKWLVPHFEKMLYDQALMLIACVETFQVTRNPEHAAMAREIASYVLRDLTSPEGGFYCAEDADSEGEEGLFYTWTAEELRSLLGADAELVARAYAVEDGGNFRDEASGRSAGTNILHLSQPISQTAREMGIEEDLLRTRLERSRRLLFDVREKRIHPLKDDKVLADWNGLMIVALAKAGATLDEPTWLEAADRAAGFVLTRMRDADGRLLKRWRDGEAGLPAVLDDYAFMAWGLVELYGATFDERRLEQALGLARTMLHAFRDENHGGLFMSSDVGERLPVRAKEIYDGALPSGNSVAALALLKLARLTGNTELEVESLSILRAFAASVARMPSAHCQFLLALDFALGPSHEIVIVGRRDAADTQAMITALRSRFMPSTVVLLRDASPDAAITRLAPFTRDMTSLNGKATAYACTGFSCSAPTTDPQELTAGL